MGAAPSAREVLNDRSIVLLLVTVLASTMATVCQATALGKLVYDLTARELDLGLLGLAEFTPAFVLVAVTGHLADRYDRRRVAMIGLAGELVCTIGLALYARSRPTAVAPIFLLILAFGVARAVVAPASRSLPADIAERRAMPRLIAMNAATWQTATIIGPIIAGFLYVVDPVWPFIASAVFLGGAIIAMAFIHPSRVIEKSTAAATRREGMRAAWAGLRVIRDSPILYGAISLDLFAVLFGGAIALLPAIAKDRLGVGAVGLGWLRAAGGIGAAMTALVLTTRPLTRRVGRTLFGVVALFGVATIVLGATRSFVVAFVALAVLSAADSISVFIRATLVPLVTPEAARGRVLAVENVFIGASNELGAFESGVAGQLLGVAWAVALGGAATLVIALAWTTMFPALGRIDRFGELTPVAPP